MVETAPEILLVDADPASRAALRALIGEVARVAEVASGEAALRAASASDFAAILIDVALPTSAAGRDAYAIVTRLRESSRGRNTPVLFLCTQPPDDSMERRGYALGAFGYLARPIDRDTLRARLGVLLTLFRHGVELRRRDELIAQQHAELVEARAALEQVATANREKDLYLGVLGHDLRTPLAAMLMSSRMLLMGDELGDSERQSVVRIARNGERMAALIRDILDYTRGQTTGGIPILPRPTDMRDICTAMIDEVALLHTARAIRFTADGDSHGDWDRERVEQVISNLLSNALTHGKGPINVHVIGRADEVIVSVHNGGAPIPVEQLPTLFEPFRRGAASRQGLGLGLYIVSEILRAHGGRIEVTSTVDAGTTFTTAWPRTRGAQST